MKIKLIILTIYSLFSTNCFCSSEQAINGIFVKFLKSIEASDPDIVDEFHSDTLHSMRQSLENSLFSLSQSGDFDMGVTGLDKERASLSDNKYISLVYQMYLQKNKIEGEQVKFKGLDVHGLLLDENIGYLVYSFPINDEDMRKSYVISFKEDKGEWKIYSAVILPQILNYWMSGSDMTPQKKTVDH